MVKTHRSLATVTGYEHHLVQLRKTTVRPLANGKV